MDDTFEFTLKKVCCTCLSIDRNLVQLSRVDDGVNKLFFLLSYDSDAYEAMFHKDAVNLFICWECKALMAKLCKFRNQACCAQKRLTDITDGKIDLKSKNITLSQLTHYHQTFFNNEYIADDETIDNFIDCGPDIDFIKTESDNDDVPLSNLQINNLIDDKESLLNDTKDVSENTGDKMFVKKKRKSFKAAEISTDNKSEFYSIIQMSEDEMIDCIEKMKSMDSYVNASSKCESCVEGFKDYNELEKHNLELHVEKQKHVQCDICYIYVKQKSLPEHRDEHFRKYICNTCEHVSYKLENLAEHLKVDHVFDVKWSKIRKNITRKSESKTKLNKTKDVKTQFGYLCVECDKYFENKNKRYKHIQKFHRDGFECTTCGKKFAFKNTLNRHEQLHRGPLPREQCPTCGKMVRADLRQSHARTHALRQAHDCRACDKRFVSRASYENHLKYSRRHAVTDVLKYKCAMCEKGYRSRGELRDHVNYQHMGKTQHKCPICDKALATRRCITRHIRRAHHGVKENAKDKICQTCGKAFRDKKCLREHELIHTGERPLSCNICGRTFRQSASLYTHKKRVHNIVPKQRIVLHTDSENNQINA
ncbi:zinc finger protein 782-like [Nymphalis io]|uniref:zinc finger protein 782-like n=1 Tax=Inachis io TaxID=171585 RepID=UPI002169947B|nr:zinc finger protein 782-like [Nymphalis io]